jgi:hypothetical protein
MDYAIAEHRALVRAYAAQTESQPGGQTQREDRNPASGERDDPRGAGQVGHRAKDKGRARGSERPRCSASATPGRPDLVTGT